MAEPLEMVIKWDTKELIEELRRLSMQIEKLQQTMSAGDQRMFVQD